jgi:hypothetical protein
VNASISRTIKTHLIRGAFYLLLLLAVCISGALLAFPRPEAPTNVSKRTLTFTQRVAYQRAIEEVYWRHRIWPKDNLDSKPSLDAVMSQAQLEKKVADYLRKSQALEDDWQRPITAKQLQAEMDRMAQHTKQPEVLRELFVVLGNDPSVIAECLARPVLAQRLVTELNNENRVKLTTIAWLATKIVCPLESTPDTQPQLQPALLRLSAIISQCFGYVSDPPRLRVLLWVAYCRISWRTPL